MKYTCDTSLEDLKQSVAASSEFLFHTETCFGFRVTVQQYIYLQSPQLRERHPVWGLPGFYITLNTQVTSTLLTAASCSNVPLEGPPSMGAPSSSLPWVTWNPLWSFYHLSSQTQYPCLMEDTCILPPDPKEVGLGGADPWGCFYSTTATSLLPGAQRHLCQVSAISTSGALWNLLPQFALVFPLPYLDSCLPLKTSIKCFMFQKFLIGL